MLMPFSLTMHALLALIESLLVSVPSSFSGFPFPYRTIFNKEFCTLETPLNTFINVKYIYLQFGFLECSSCTVSGARFGID